MTVLRCTTALVLCATLHGCGRGAPASSPDLALTAARARADHAAHCLNLTSAIASLPAGHLRNQAADLGLARITPELASRWMPVWKRAATDAHLTPADAEARLHENAVAVRDDADLDRLVDDAFECGSTVDVPTPD